jgi:hypothetical protein
MAEDGPAKRRRDFVLKAEPGQKTYAPSTFYGSQEGGQSTLVLLRLSLMISAVTITLPVARPVKPGYYND